MRLVGLTLLLLCAYVASKSSYSRSKSKSKASSSLVVQKPLKASLPTRSSSESRKKKKKKVPILPTGKKSKKGGKLGKGLVKQYKVAQNLLERSADLTKGATNSVNRLIKSWLSSDFEKLLLALTSPDDLRPSSRDTAEFMATVKSFVLDENTSPLNEDNPYRVCLRKLNSKVSEPDGRTTLKALYLLHLVFKNSDGKDATLFKALFKKMRKERVVSKKKAAHFSMELLSDCTLETQYLSDFIEVCGICIQAWAPFHGLLQELRRVSDYSMRTGHLPGAGRRGEGVGERIGLWAGGEWRGLRTGLCHRVTCGRGRPGLFRDVLRQLRWVLRKRRSGSYSTARSGGRAT